MCIAIDINAAFTDYLPCYRGPQMKTLSVRNGIAFKEMCTVH